MLNLYREEQGVEELLTAAELQSLIITTASLWNQCSLSWKAPTGQVLRTISKAQTKNAIMYLQGLVFPEHLWDEFLQEKSHLDRFSFYIHPRVNHLEMHEL